MSQNRFIKRKMVQEIICDNCKKKVKKSEFRKVCIFEPRDENLLAKNTKFDLCFECLSKIGWLRQW